MIGSNADPSTAGAVGERVMMHTTLERTVTGANSILTTLLTHFRSVELGEGPAITEIVVLTPYTSFEWSTMRGAMSTFPDVSSEVSATRNDDESEGFTHAQEARAPDTMANVITDRSAATETPLRLARIVHNRDREADMRE